MADEIMVQDNTQVIEVKDNNTQLANPFTSTTSFQEMFDMAKMLASADVVPDNYKGKPMNCLIAMDYSNRMGMSVYQVMQGLNIIKGKTTWNGQSCASIVNGCGLFTDVDLVYVGEEGKDSYGAYVEATRKRDGKRIKGTVVTMEMAKSEGWTNNSKWKSMKTQMLGYRAYSFFARLYCPNALGGFMTEGEIEDSQSKSINNVDNPF